MCRGVLVIRESIESTGISELVVGSIFDLRPLWSASYRHGLPRYGISPEVLLWQSMYPDVGDCQLFEVRFSYTVGAKSGASDSHLGILFPPRG